LLGSLGSSLSSSLLSDGFSSVGLSSFGGTGSSVVVVSISARYVEHTYPLYDVEFPS